MGMIEEGDENPDWDPLLDALVDIKVAGSEVAIPPFEFSKLLPENVDKFWRYSGSLTTPDCNELVIWTVFKDKVTLSKKQIQKFNQLMTDAGDSLVDNFRPPQPLNNREVFFYKGCYD